MNHKELIERLRSGAGIARERVVFSGLAPLADEAADMIEAVIAERDEYQQAADKMAMEHKVERDTLRQQLAESQALIEASRKQEACVEIIADVSGHLSTHWRDQYIPNAGDLLYAAPVVADDVLKDAQRYRYLFAGNQVYSQFARVYQGWDGSGGKKGFDTAIDAAMGGAA